MNFRIVMIGRRRGDAADSPASLVGLGSVLDGPGRSGSKYDLLYWEFGPVCRSRDRGNNARTGETALRRGFSRDQSTK